jgi:micrococcal nuclease
MQIGSALWRIGKLIIIIALSIVIIVLLTEFEQKRLGDDLNMPTYSVVRVADGDTITVNYNGKNERVRLIGIDSPELNVETNNPECFARESAAFAKDRMAGQRVGLVFDDSQGKRDRFDRLLAHIILPGGENYQQLALANGYANYFRYNKPFLFDDAYKQAENLAKQKNRGLWKSCL